MTTVQERLATAGCAATLCTALTLAPLVRWGPWPLVAAATAVAVTMTGLVVRHLLRRWPLVLLAQALTLLSACCLFFARSTALLGLLPTPASLRALSALVSSGLDTAAHQVAPVETTRGVTLLLVLGTGALAMLVDLVAVSWGRPAAAGLPLLAAYCLPATLLPHGLPWYLFALAALGYALLLGVDADERLGDWGRRVGRSHRAVRGRPRSSGGRGVAVGAVALAIVAPMAVPGLSDALPAGPRGGGHGAGLSEVRTLNPILALRDDLDSQDPDPWLTYTSASGSGTQLRVVTDNVYDGRTWAPAATRLDRDRQVRYGLSAPPGLRRGVLATPLSTSVRVSPRLRENYLPLPYPSRHVAIDGLWLYDPATLNVVGINRDSAGSVYTVRHDGLAPTAAQLNAAPRAPASLAADLALPAGTPAVIADTARRVAGTGSPYQQAVRLQRWLREGGGFVYSLRAPETGSRDPAQDAGSDAMAAFLRQRHGYCVHFASAMAVMARSLGVPARVAVGFLPGRRQADGTWTVHGTDAHAWPELYFEGVGWVPFEPTPRDAQTAAPAWTAPAPGIMPEDRAARSVPRPASPTASRPPRAAPPSTAPDQAASHAVDRAAGQIPWRLLGVAFLALLALLALAAPAVTARVAARRRWAGALDPGARAETAWDELCAGLADVGRPVPTSVSPRAGARAVQGQHQLEGAPAAALLRLATDLELVRYAPPGTAEDRDIGRRRADVRSVLRGAGERLPARRRHLARWWPRSGRRTLLSLPRSAATTGRELIHRGLAPAGARLSGWLARS